VACNGDGLPVFDRLRYRRQDGRVFLYPFDLLGLNGQDMRREPLEVRKGALASVPLSKAGVGIQFNEHCDDLPADVVGSPYRSGRSRDWRMKNPNAPAVKKRKRVGLNGHYS
jgi:bifunctional non-homologous end joining protein LigD